MGSPCLFTRQQVLKVGYFYWLRIKNLNHLHAELSLGYLEDAKFYLESKASFIHIPYLLVYKLNSCISRPLIFQVKNQNFHHLWLKK